MPPSTPSRLFFNSLLTLYTTNPGLSTRGSLMHQGLWVIARG